MAYSLRVVLLTCWVMAFTSNAQFNPVLMQKVFGTAFPSTKDFEDNAAISTSSDSARCRCVPRWRCDDGTAVGPRQSCEDTNDICCKLENVKSVSPSVPSRSNHCGYRRRLNTSTNNDVTEFGDFPWVVTVRDANGTFYGLGTLIHPQVVMTSAHIVVNFRPGTLKVVAGEWAVPTDRDHLPSQERLVNYISTRNDFSKLSQNGHDIALLHLAQPLQLADHINVICLPEQGESFDGYKDCVAHGLRRSFDTLHTVKLDMMDDQTCEQMLNTRLRGFKLHESLMCAEADSGNDTCELAVGAPLACPVVDGRYELSGVVFQVVDCGQQNLPVLNTRVSNFRQWVDSIANTWGFDTTSYLKGAGNKQDIRDSMRWKIEIDLHLQPLAPNADIVE